jgi:predicted HicB family RNase H-like nuclease
VVGSFHRPHPSKEAKPYQVRDARFGTGRSNTMNNTMSYKGYTARIEYSAEDQCLKGHMAGIRDIIGFHGESVNELRQSFEEAVNDYLYTCEKVGKAPQQPYSCNLILQITHKSTLPSQMPLK